MKKATALILALVMLLALAACGGSTSGTPSSTAPESSSDTNNSGEATYKWRMASTWNATDPQGMGDAFLAQRINELTNGQVEVTVYPSMQLGDPMKALDSVTQGIIEMAVVAASTSTDERFAITLLPFMVENYEEANELIYSDGFWTDYVTDIYADHGLVRIANIDNDFRGLNSCKKPVTKAADMAGMLIRESGYKPYQDFYALCGATCTTVPFSELYTALEKGLCDAQDNGPMNSVANKLYDAAPYYTQMQQAYCVTFDVINQDLYNSLPSDIQEAIMQAAAETEDYVNNLIQNEGYAEKALQTMIDDPSVEVITRDQIAEEDMADFREKGISVWANYEEIIGKDILDQLYAFKGIK